MTGPDIVTMRVSVRHWPVRVLVPAAFGQSLRQQLSAAPVTLAAVCARNSVS